jgi:hypothetical protein
VSERPSASELLRRPEAFLTRSDLRELGLPRAAVDAIFRELDLVLLPGYSRPMIRVAGFLDLIERETYGNDVVHPVRRNGGG